MQNSSLNYDKVMKPVSRAAESLKRNKDLKRHFSKVIDKVDQLECAATDIAKFKSVVDEKSFDQKVSLLKTLQQSCKDAVSEMTRLSKLKSKEDAKEAKKDPKAKAESDNPALEALASSLDDLKSQVDKDLNAFEQWFDKAAKPGTMEIKVPRDVTDMIALVDTGGRIGLPSDQSFDAKITLSFEGVPGVEQALKENGKEFIGEIGRALKPIKEDLAKAFKAWNSQFSGIVSDYDKPAAEKLFKDINSWFTDKLPKLAKPALESAAEKAVADICSQSKDFKQAAKQIKIDVVPDYKNIAEFVLTFPENPADDATKAIGKGVEGLEGTLKEYKAAVDGVVKGHDSVSKALRALTEKMKKAGGGKEKPDLSKELEALNTETSKLDTAVKSGKKNSQELDKQLKDVKKKFDDSAKGALKDNATVNKSQVESLKRVLSDSEAKLKQPIPDQLSTLEDLVKSIKENHKTITGLGDAPKPEDLTKALKTLEPLSVSFDKQQAKLATNLSLPPEADKLKSMADSIKT